MRLGKWGIGLLFISLFVLSLPLSAKEKKSEETPAQTKPLTIYPEGAPLMFPDDLKQCFVFNSQQLIKSIQRSNVTGDCEWIIMRPSTDLDQGPFWLQFDESITFEYKHPQAKGHPLVITNETGRSVVLRQPKSGGCSMILCRDDFVLMGILIEGGICSCYERKYN